MVRLSIVIITLNEECNIERCLQSVKAVADEIVVVSDVKCMEQGAVIDGWRFRSPWRSQEAEGQRYVHLYLHNSA